MAEEATQDTLRDTLEAAFEEHVPVEGDAPEKPAPVSQPAPSGELAKAPEVAAAADDRPRGPDGKFLPKTEATQAAAPKPQAALAPQPAAAPALAPIPRPSSWEKGMWPIWDKLSAGVPLTPEESRKAAEYNVKREGHFAQGVSTYKQEFDRAKPVMDAISPHMQELQSRGLDPAALVGQYLQVNRVLATGSPQDKLGMLMRIAQDYQIPLHALFQQGQDGRVTFNPQVQPYQPPQAQQAQPQHSMEQLLEAKLAQRDAAQALERFESDAPQKYQHYETVKETMARLLEAGFARDYPDAYERALRQPEHSDIFDALQEQKRAATEAEKAKALAETAARARRQNVSVRSATPASKAAPKDGKRSLRQELEENFDQHTDASRV